MTPTDLPLDPECPDNRPEHVVGQQRASAARLNVSRLTEAYRLHDVADLSKMTGLGSLADSMAGLGSRSALGSLSAFGSGSLAESVAGIGKLHAAASADLSKMTGLGSLADSMAGRAAWLPAAPSGSWHSNFDDFIVLDSDASTPVLEWLRSRKPTLGQAKNAFELIAALHLSWAWLESHTIGYAEAVVIAWMIVLLHLLERRQ